MGNIDSFYLFLQMLLIETKNKVKKLFQEKNLLCKKGWISAPIDIKGLDSKRMQNFRTLPERPD